MHESSNTGMATGLLAVCLLACGIFLGSRNLLDYDPALFTYTSSTLFAIFAMAYRYSIWLQRPATRMYWRRIMALLLAGNVCRNVLFLVRALLMNFAAQGFILRRNVHRWFAHMLFSWGTLLAAAVTLPLVFGWIHFESAPGDPAVYRIILFGLTVDAFHVASFKGRILLNLLNVSSVMVILGAGLALQRRLRTGCRTPSRQQFGQDMIPLTLLLAIAVTGLMLTFSMLFLQGHGYQFLSLIHALTVALTMIYAPFGKFFHVLQRPLHLAVSLYQRRDRQSRAICRRCRRSYAGDMQIRDLKIVLAQMGMDWRLHGGEAHYMEVCPACRRKMTGVFQGRAMSRAGGAVRVCDGPPAAVFHASAIGAASSIRTGLHDTLA